MNDLWIREGLADPLSEYLNYLVSRGVDESCKVSFHSWQTHENIKCTRFLSQYGNGGRGISSHLVIPITSPRGVIIGMESRKIMPDGSKKVIQYRTLSAQWNPYILGAEDCFKTLHEGGDLWVVEGIFDKVSLDKVVSKYDSVIATLRAGMDSLTLEMISRYYSKASTIYICYDNDETGQKKAKWLQKEMQAKGIRAVVWKYRGKDPNEVWSKGGDQALRRMFL